MLSYIRRPTVLNNAGLVARCLGGHAPSDDLDALHAAYHRGLSAAQRYRVDYDPNRAEPLTTRRLGDRGLEHQLFGRSWSPEMECSVADLATMPRARREVDAYDDDFALAVRLLIGSFVFSRLPGYGGGSVGDAAGVVWINPASDPGGQDLSEKIIHETTHQCLFLHEMVHGLFDEPERWRRCLVVSAILGIPRGYARSLHSAAVAAVLADFALYRGRISRARTLVDGLARTNRDLVAVDNRERCLSGAGPAVLDELVEVCARLQEALRDHSTN